MATEELVTEQFQFLGIDVKKEVLSKCVTLCEEYDIDAETLVEQWVAFSLTNLNGAAPTLDSLGLLERKEFSKRAANRLETPAAKEARSSAGVGVAVFGAPASHEQQHEVINNYMITTPKRVKSEPEVNVNQSELCPATYSPKTAHSAKYTSRANAGAVLHSYGDENLLQSLSRPSNVNDLINLNITVVPNDDGELYNKAMFGFELLHEKASIHDNHIRYISQCIMKKAGITETVSVRQKTQNEVYVAGRIECDADARLNPKCVVLQGTWEESLSQAVPVDLDNVKQYSLFPGQVAVLRGVNPRGERFVAREVLVDAAPPAPSHAADLVNTLTGTMSLVVAAGPYTTSDNLAYEPLKDLITYITTNKPNVVIMTGPFLDSDHTNVKDNTMAETYKSFFDKLLDSIGELQNTSPLTKVYIVSSLKDAFHVNIYPTPAYSSRRKHPNIQFLPDPCTLNMNGVIVGVTSTDVLMQICQEEISFGMSGDKLSRLAGHVVSQQTYWAVWPAPLAADAALWAAHAQLPCTPHVLLLPSNFRYFVKEVNDCVVVNPEHLTKGTGGGTFARILVSNTEDNKLNIAAQIVRI